MAEVPIAWLIWIRGPSGDFISPLVYPTRRFLTRLGLSFTPLLCCLTAFTLARDAFHLILLRLGIRADSYRAPATCDTSPWPRQSPVPASSCSNENRSLQRSLQLSNSRFRVLPCASSIVFSETTEQRPCKTWLTTKRHRVQRHQLRRIGHHPMVHGHAICNDIEARSQRSPASKRLRGCRP